MQHGDKMAAAAPPLPRRRPSSASAAAHFFEDELAAHRKRQEAKDRQFQEMLAALKLESAARNHSVQVFWLFSLFWPLTENRC